MATKEDVKRLAALARIEIGEENLDSFTKEFDTVLTYIGQLEKLELPADLKQKPALKNVMREDGEPHPTGVYTEKLIEQFPKREGSSLSVKQVISHD